MLLKKMNETLKIIAGHHNAAKQAKTPDEKNELIDAADDANKGAQDLLNNAMSRVEHQEEVNKRLEENKRALEQSVKKQIAEEQHHIANLRKAEAVAESTLAKEQQANQKLENGTDNGNAQKPETIVNDPSNCYLVRL